LENLWLPDRHGANGNFYKGLIQLAARSCICRKTGCVRRRRCSNWRRPTLKKYPRVHEQLDVAAVLELISKWFNSWNLEISPLIRSRLKISRDLHCCPRAIPAGFFTTASANSASAISAGMKNYCDGMV